ncbi:MAG: InlB B-repeat-containing protein, partial [archaeon]
DLIVEADENYTFTGWTGDNGTIDNASSNETTITMEGNYTITANFEEETEDEETEPTPVTPTAAPGQNTTTILILFLTTLTIYTINKKE